MSGISGQTFGLILSFLVSRQLQGALDGKSSPKYPVNSGVLQNSILDLKLPLVYFSGLPFDFVMLTILLSTLSVTRYLICSNN